MEDYIIDVYVPVHDVVSVRSTGQKVKKFSAGPPALLFFLGMTVVY